MVAAGSSSTKGPAAGRPQPEPVAVEAVEAAAEAAAVSAAAAAAAAQASSGPGKAAAAPAPAVVAVVAEVEEEEEDSDDEEGPVIVAPPRPKRGGLLGAFDALPQQTQMVVVAGAFGVGMLLLPFLQPTSIYGDTSAAAQKAAAVAAAQPAVAQEQPARQPIPVVQPLLDGLQAFAMPRTLPDGRTESPGVLRIYLASMAILAAFYAVSAALQLVLNGVVALLRAAGVLRGSSAGGSAKPAAG